MKAIDYSMLDVFVLTYNRAEYLKVMLESLCMQTANGFSIKILNNASTDNTLDVIRDIKLKYPNRNIQTITNKTNLGNPGNFKYSQELASNVYTAVFHDDDVIHPEYVEAAINIFMDTPSLVMCSGMHQALWNANNDNWDLLHKDYYIYPRDMGISLQLLISRPTFACNIYKTEFYKKVTYHPELYGKLHDIVFMMELSKLGAVALIIGVCVRWRQSDANDSNNLTTGPFPFEIINIIKKIKELNPKHGLLIEMSLWSFAYFLYKWSMLERFLKWQEFSHILIANGGGGGLLGPVRQKQMSYQSSPFVYFKTGFSKNA
ncbi:glycosyltransferase family A protein [Helicobacter sp. 11S02629-2]|uniref:glycosyltransferase family 2 protein n=1 Tax=Helicobacter sp. 11S02629-2 TaxID=1476195 RepID=UPI000BA699A8|nr:glycosyltransferase family A protein [Helicobacter sp. 11S02629-2]PAF44652.1 hypothetical protein BKH40_05340 [Helicobacter sp. 11S02629-2]